MSIADLHLAPLIGFASMHAFVQNAAFVQDATVVQSAAAALVSSLWQGIALASIVAICLGLVPSAPARVRFMVWTVAFAVLAALPLLNVVFTGHSSAAGLAAARQLQLAPVWSYAVAGVWAAAGAIRAAQLLLEGMKLRFLWNSAVPVSTELLPELPLGKAKLCISTDLDRPSVIGFFSPRVLIPAWLFEQLTPGELEQIVVHEMEHLRRRDDWMNLLQKIGLVFFPLNPALFWIDRRLATERELACDDGVLARTKAPRAYASCLTSLAERRMDHRRRNRIAELALGATGEFRRTEFSRRIESILGSGKRTTLSASTSRAFAALMMMGAVGGAATLAHAPQFVSFNAQSRSQAASEVATQAVVNRRPVSRPVRAATEMPPARFEDAIFHSQQSAGNSPVQHPAKLRPPSKSRPATTATAIDTVYSAPNQAPVRQEMLRTSWQQSAPQAVLLTLPDGRTFLATYTADPDRAGWLLIQL